MARIAEEFVTLSQKLSQFNVADNEARNVIQEVTNETFKLKGDIALNAGDASQGLKYYQKAQSSALELGFKIKYNLAIASANIAQDQFEEALQTLESILDENDIGFNEKNNAEELLAYVKQKMGI